MTVHTLPLVAGTPVPAPLGPRILSVDGLNVAFRQGRDWRSVVDGVSFEIAAGETLALVGESGSGKSVTAYAVMRLLAEGNSRVSGRVRFAGADLLALTERAMQRIRGDEIAMIFQEPMTSLNPVATVGRQIGESLLLHRGMTGPAARAETIRLLERVRIPEPARRVDAYPHELSGGQRQRVMIAMALACRPKLLIADEPTTALDVTIQAEILALIRELQREDGTAVLFITHDMGVVAEIADRVAVLNGGRLVEQGDTADIFSAPREPYTRRLLAAVPKLGSLAGSPLPVKFPVIDASTGLASPPEPARDTVDTAASPILEVRDLVVSYPGGGGFGARAPRTRAVNGLSFAIRPGETLALVGESGCGKSTTGRAIVGLVKPDRGTVSVDGRDVHASRAGAPRPGKAQMIFQDPFGSLDPRMSIGQAIAEPIIYHRLEEGGPAAVAARVAELLDQVGLPGGVTGRYPHEFSGGQRQRICIAWALALRPRLLIADEAVSALDVSIKAQVLNLLLTLQERLGLAILFISHDIAAVERVSHRIGVMHRGELVETGTRAALLSAPRHPYTRKLLASVPVPEPRTRTRG